MLVPSTEREMYIKYPVRGMLLGKIPSNHKAIDDSIANIDGAARVLRAQQAVKEAKKMAALCAESASRAGTAQEISAACGTGVRN